MTAEHGRGMSDLRQSGAGGGGCATGPEAAGEPSAARAALRQVEAERDRLKAQLLEAQKMEAVGTLAGSVAHDFNNMLGVILGHTELALERVTPGQPLHDYLRAIQKAAQRSADLTRQLLAFARKQPVTARLIELNEAVGGLVPVLRKLVGEEIELVWQPGGEALWVSLDSGQLSQVLVNLCANARDAITGVGRITVQTGGVAAGAVPGVAGVAPLSGPHGVLAVSDTGCGMTEEVRQHVFDAFFTTKEAGRGTGLGLVAVQEIAQQNGGFVEVQSVLGRGTTFRFLLPRRTAPGLVETAPVEAPRVASVRGQETLLLVEDEPTMLRMGKAMLEKLGYRVLPAGRAAEAIALADQHAGQVDLLLADVVMPEMNGVELAKRLTGRYPRIKCLFMSGYTSSVIAQHGVEETGMHFIRKPFSIKTLEATVRNLLDNG